MSYPRLPKSDMFSCKPGVPSRSELRRDTRHGLDWAGLPSFSSRSGPWWSQCPATFALLITSTPACCLAPVRQQAGILKCAVSPYPIKSQPMLRLLYLSKVVQVRARPERRFRHRNADANHGWVEVL